IPPICESQAPRFSDGVVDSVVGEVVPECRPAAVQNTFAEVMVAHPMGDREIFERDPVVLFNQGGPPLVQVVLALVGDVFLLALDAQQRLATVVRAALRPRPVALKDTQLLLRRPP
ncbi:MAG: hypothetical protein ABI700_17415, partial [Chloroflexota bacterium]